MRGQARTPTPTDAAKAREYFETAIHKDAGYAPVYASLAELYIWTGGAGTLTNETSVHHEAHLKAREWAEKALKLDDMLADAHNALGTVKLAGRHEEGMASLQTALDLDPSTTMRGSCSPERMCPTASTSAHARSGNREKALALVEQLKRNGGPQPGNAPAFVLAWAYAGLDDKEQAFAWLERAREERRQRLTWLNVDPLLEPLRSDPRFTDLARRIGLPQR